MPRNVNLALIGTGLVGTAFLKQISESRFHDKIKVIALASSRKMLLSSPSQPLSASSTGELVSSETSIDYAKLASHLLEKSKEIQAVPVIVDCTASGDVGKLYPEWMERSISIVTPNKKGFSSDYALFEKVYSLRDRASIYHESTVGAGLPVISTLQDMVETGDEVVKIEGILSGTLSFLFNSYSSANASGASFSEIVKEARARGYTEPDPRDDLNGLDMARKLVILGRISGLNLSLETLDVENIVPEALRSIPSADEFMAKLPEFDAHFAKMNEEAKQNQQVLRYVGVIDPKGKSFVKLGRYPKEHPFASMKGSDNIVSFTTKRYPNPLIIQGAGAGAEVTAAGVLGDILKIVRANL